MVSTPIGNLEDITLRALRVLKEVDAIAAEDTRRSLKLLSHFGISKPLISYWSEREKVRTEEILRRLRAGQSVALVSDSGTPGISDPGGVLVREALGEGMAVRPIPGACALIAALSVSGLASDEFTFIGFLPAKQEHRRKKLAAISREERTLIFYEAPHRLVETIGDMERVLGNRKTAVLKEITKLHEQTITGLLNDVARKLSDSVIAGEYVIVMEGRRTEACPLDEAVEEVIALMRTGMGRKEAALRVAGHYGMSKRTLYERSLRGVSGSPD